MDDRAPLSEFGGMGAHGCYHPAMNRMLRWALLVLAVSGGCV